MALPVACCAACRATGSSRRSSTGTGTTMPSLVFTCILLCAAWKSANAAASRSWSTYVPKQVGRCWEAEQAGRGPSGLWGCNGEAWESSGPLADWTYSGYGAGLAPIPNPPVKYDVKRDFKAAGDGSTDDTNAVLAAVSACKKNGGVIYFPPGRYSLSQQLNISSNTVLRGAGRDKTVLHFTKSMQDLYGWGSKYSPGRSNSPFTWSGGLISTEKNSKLIKDVGFIGDINRPAERGMSKVYLDFTRSENKGKAADQVFKTGDWIAIRMYEDKQANLAKSLSNNRAPVGNRIGPMFGTRMVFTHNARVVSAGRDFVEFDRPLTVDVETRFGPQLFKTANFKVTHVGIEDLEICFPWTPYLGHHEEKGYNGIELEAAVNSWIRRIRIVNADAAIKLYSTMFTTVSDVQIYNHPKPRSGGLWNGRKDGMIADKDGHIGIALHWACFDNLVEKFDIQGNFYHELLVAGYSAHNVFSNGKGYDLTMDHHGAAPHNNLWTDIDLGLGTSAMDWSGDPQHFPYGGSSNVFWNIYASRIVQERATGSSSAYRRAGPLMSNARMALRQHRLKSDPRFSDRPAREQGFGQVVVDMPVDPNVRYIREAGDWLVQYDPYKPVYPPNLFAAQRSTQSRRLRLPKAQSSLPTAALLNKPLTS